MRLASSALHSTSSVKRFARRTLSRILSTASSRVIRSLALRCRSEVERKTWMRPRAAPADRLARQVDVPVGAARQRGDDRAPHLGRDLLHAPEVGFGRRREPGLDHVHPEHLELPGEPHLLVHGRLLPGACSPSLSVVSKILTSRPILPPTRKRKRGTCWWGPRRLPAVTACSAIDLRAPLIPPE